LGGQTALDAGSDDGSHLALSKIRATRALRFQGVDLPTRSACQTARGGDRAEIDGFGTNAQLNGTASVMASLWPASDAAPDAGFLSGDEGGRSGQSVGPASRANGDAEGGAKSIWPPNVMRPPWTMPRQNQGWVSITPISGRPLFRWEIGDRQSHSVALPIQLNTDGTLLRSLRLNVGRCAGDVPRNLCIQPSVHPAWGA
jgi:hypothetical protein